MSHRRILIYLGGGGMIGFLGAVTAELHWRQGVNWESTLNAVGGLGTALTVVGGVVGFLLQRESEHEADATAREEKRAARRLDEQARALEVVRQASASLSGLDPGLVLLANTLTVEQAKACYEARRFALTEEQRPKFEDLLAPESVGTADAPRQLRLKHVMALQGVALNYLNILESALIARQRGLADADEIKRQFAGFYENGRMMLAGFIDAAGRKAAFPWLCEFEDELRRESKPDVKPVST
jgi:hypothetical protein